MAGWRRAGGVLALGSMLLGLVPPAAATVGPSGLVDVTATREGRVQAQRVAHRRAERGQATPLAELRVYRFAPGGFGVAPRGIRVLAASAILDAGGRARVRVDVRIGAAPEPASAGGLVAATGPSWSWVDGDCFDALFSSFGYSVSCYSLSHVAADGSATRDFWALEQWSVTGPTFHTGLTPNTRIYDAWIAAQRAASSPVMTWVDWSPRGDRSGSCQDIGLSVTALKLPLAGTFEMCEQWDATWYAEAGRFRNQWKCGCVYPFGVQWDREVAYMLAVSVPNGTFPSWVLSQGFLAF